MGVWMTIRSLGLFQECRQYLSYGDGASLSNHEAIDDATRLGVGVAVLIPAFSHARLRQKRGQEEGRGPGRRVGTISAVGKQCASLGFALVSRGLHLDPGGGWA